MTSPPRQITVQCPTCGERFKDWSRDSINLDIEEWTVEEVREATTATCPRCATVINLDAIVVEGDVWTVAG